MIVPRGALSALLLGSTLAACADQTGVPSSADLPLAFSVTGPSAVSAAETAALAAAFDIVDAYDITVEIAATNEPITQVTIEITPGQTTHTLDVTVPQSALGRTVRITLVGLANGIEMYRSVAVTTLSSTLGRTQVSLEVRYTGPGIRGVVVDEAGAGVPDVGISLIDGQTVVDAVTTEPDGTYLFLDVSPASYRVQPTPPGQSTYLCPSDRFVTIAGSNDALAADFLLSTVLCGNDVLVLSGGDFDDTPAVQAWLARDPDLTVSTFFHVNQLPTLAFLKQHDVVLLFANGLFDESSGLGTRVAQYVDAGGNVVIGSFYWQNRSDSQLGSTGWGELEAFDPFTSTGGATYQIGINGVIEDDPLTPVLTAGIVTWSSTGFWGGVAERTGTGVVARWEDGTPFIGYRILPAGQRLVGVSIFPGSDFSNSGGDWQAAFVNAVTWAGMAGGPVPN